MPQNSLKIDSPLEIGLFIDTSSERGVAALFSHEQAFSHVHFKSADNLMTYLDQLFKQAEISSKDLKWIAAGVGPGSFTGIRIGQMVARALAYSLKVPLLGVSSLEIYSENCPVVVDARIGGVWAQFPEKSAIMASPTEIADLFDNVSTIITPDATRLKARWLSNFKGEIIEQGPDLRVIGRLISQAKKASNGERPEIVYLRKTQAEMERDGLF